MQSHEEGNADELWAGRRIKLECKEVALEGGKITYREVE